MNSIAPLGIAVLGASGRLGQSVLACASNDSRFELVAAWSRTPRTAAPWTDDLGAACAAADVVIDCTLPAATSQVLDACIDNQTALVSAVTGLDGEQQSALAHAAQRIALLHEHNMSVGVHVLADLVQRAAAALPEEFRVELVETHHSQKRDAPSGTAITLAAAASLRQKGDIPIASLRGGSVIGEHVVHFLGPLERLELTHRADDRQVFAAGALRAALWLRGRAAGRVYRFADMLDPNVE